MHLLCRFLIKHILSLIECLLYHKLYIAIILIQRFQGKFPNIFLWFNNHIYDFGDLINVF